MKSPIVALLSVATAMILTIVMAPSAGAGTYTLLKESRKSGVTARLWLNSQTRAIHAQGLGLRAGEIVRIDVYAGITRDTKVAQRDGVSLSTRSFKIYPESYSACAGSPAGGTRFICTPYHRHNG
jgi:hypothetical protein